MEKQRQWLLEDGVALIQALEPGVRKSFNYCTALGGSVLHKGSSFKDLDIILLPIEDDTPNNEEALITYLEKEYFAKPAIIGAEGEEKYGPSKTRSVYKGIGATGRAIDFFIYKRVL